MSTNLLNTSLHPNNEKNPNQPTTAFTPMSTLQEYNNNSSQTPENPQFFQQYITTSQYEKLQQNVQKSEESIRVHVKNENQLRIIIEDLQQKLTQETKNKHQLLEGYKRDIKKYKKENEDLLTRVKELEKENLSLKKMIKELNQTVAITMANNNFSNQNDKHQPTWGNSHNKQIIPNHHSNPHNIVQPFHLNKQPHTQLPPSSSAIKIINESTTPPALRGIASRTHSRQKIKVTIKDDQQQQLQSHPSHSLQKLHHHHHERSISASDMSSGREQNRKNPPPPQNLHHQNRGRSINKLMEMKNGIVNGNSSGGGYIDIATGSKGEIKALNTQTHRPEINERSNKFVGGGEQQRQLQQHSYKKKDHLIKLKHNVD